MRLRSHPSVAFVPDRRAASYALGRPMVADWKTADKTEFFFYIFTKKHF
jgi:hypothetical protein